MCSCLDASGWFWIVWPIYEWVESVAGRSVAVLCWARIKSMWKTLKIDVYSSWKRRGSSRLVGLSPGLPGEVLLQRHHLLSAPLRRCPLLSLHTQMLFDLQLQIIALLDQCRRCRCRQKRQQFTLKPTDYNPSEGLQRHRASV